MRLSAHGIMLQMGMLSEPEPSGSCGIPSLLESLVFFRPLDVPGLPTSPVILRLHTGGFALAIRHFEPAPWIGLALVVLLPGGLPGFLFCVSEPVGSLSVELASSSNGPRRSIIGTLAVRSGDLLALGPNLLGAGIRIVAVGVGEELGPGIVAEPPVSLRASDALTI